MSKKPKKSVLVDMTEKIGSITVQLEELNAGLWTIALELSKFNEQLEQTFKTLEEKGLITRSR
jgi:hypothetical protein